MINREQMLGLLETQINTNHAYYGDKWPTVWRRNSIRNSIYREYAEFLDEVEGAWHCYKPNPTFNRVNAVYELVDIIHFMLCNVLVEHDIKTVEGVRRLVFALPTVNTSENTFPAMENAFTEYMYSSGDIWCLACFLEKACKYLEVDDDTYLKAHMRKNARNRVRASSGVLEGKYDKSAELPLTLEFLDE